MCNEAQDVCGGCDDDLDGDGARSIACGGNDCDDEDETRFPGNLEVCDVAGVDEDCDPLSLGDVDLDEDQQVDDACCNGARCGLDCDDQRSNVHRLAPEVCDGFDNNCNTETDEGLLVNSWPDLDEDDYGDAAATPTTGCSVPTGRADRGGDCDDGNDAIHPDADEPCNAVDDDCDDMTDEGGAAACETEFPGSVALCTSGECIITGCTGNRFDCNGSFTDGCEVDVCTSVASCDGCNFPCWEAGAYCSGGECSHQRATASSGGTLRDVTTGEPIAGATITFIGTCATYTATTNAAGEYDLPHRPVSWARIEAPGYPTHIQPRNDDTGFGPIVSQAALDAWLATQTVTVDPTRAIILANMLPDGAPGDLIFTARDGTQLYADANVLTPGDTGDRVLSERVARPRDRRRVARDQRVLLQLRAAGGADARGRRRHRRGRLLVRWRLLLRLTSRRACRHTRTPRPPDPTVARALREASSAAPWTPRTGRCPWTPCTRRPR
jgi:hypothetical protein